MSATGPTTPGERCPDCGEYNNQCYCASDAERGGESGCTCESGDRRGCYVHDYTVPARPAPLAEPSAPEPVQTQETLAGLLAEHAIVYENDGGDYGGHSWFECLCDRENVLNATEYATEAEHLAHVEAAVLAAGWVSPADHARALTEAWDQAVRAVANVDPRAIHNPYRQEQP